MTRFDLEDKIMAVWSTKEDVSLLMRQHCDRAEPMTEDEVQNALLGIETLMEMRCQELWDCFVKVFELKDNLSEKCVQVSDKTVHEAVLAEREACAKVCEEQAVAKRFASSYEEGFADGADMCANAIRTRGGGNDNGLQTM